MGRQIVSYAETRPARSGTPPERGFASGDKRGLLIKKWRLLGDFN